MRVTRTTLAATAALLASACGRDTGPTETRLEPAALVRYVHAVPDTSATDWTPIDHLELSPRGLALNFRDFTSFQRMGVGNRRLRVFPTSDVAEITSRFLIDTVLTFDANKYYTLLHTGFARATRPAGAPEDQLVVITDDNIPTPPANQFAFRVIHAGPAGSGIGNVDVFASATGGTSALPATATFSNVAFGTASTYATRDTGALVLRVTATGTRTPVLVESTAPAGTPASGSLSAAAGSRIGGSVLTAVIFPRSVSGSAARSFTTPGIVWLTDRRP